MRLGVVLVVLQYAQGVIIMVRVDEVAMCGVGTAVVVVIFF